MERCLESRARQRRRRGWAAIGSEARTRLALWAVLLVALISFSQVFGSGDYPGPALIAVGLATGIALGARRLGAGSISTLLVSSAVLVWYLVLIFQARRTIGGIPTLDALDALWRSLGRAWERSQIDFAPVPMRPGYAVMIVTGMFLSATIGEIATFRWRRPVLAVLGPIVLFAVAMVVGTGQASALLTMLFLAALLLYWASESSHRLRSWGRWVSAWAHHRDVQPAPLSGGLARRLGATCLAAALVSPLFLPALGDGLVSWRSGLGGGLGSGGGQGDTVDPWVSIRPSLVNQSPEVLFEVVSQQASYWRVATLERFDGENWHEAPKARVGSDEGDIEGPRPPLTHSEELGYEVVSTGLGGEALPTAPTAANVSSEEHSPSQLTFDPDSGNVFVRDQIEEGDTFEVVSTVPNAGYRELRKAKPGTPAEIPAMYFETHRPIDPRVRALLDEWTEGTETPYEALVEIQAELRGYSYTVEPDAPQGDDLIADFLLRTKAGYCQQYSTAFAMIARWQGLPSRVSVGFLPGEKEIGADRYLVSGSDAHAWPEVFFPEYGWVAFEPTPRGAVGAVPPSYTSEPVEGGLSGINANNPFSSTGREGRQTGAGPLEEVGGGDQVDVRSGSQGAGAGREDREARTQPWERTFGTLIRILMLGALLYLIVVPLSKRLRTRMRYARATDADSLAVAAFADFEEAAAELSDARHPWESARTYASRIRAAGAIADHSAARLTEIYEAAAFGPNDISVNQGEESKRLAERCRGQLWAAAGWPARAGYLFSLGRALPPGGIRNGLAVRLRTKSAS